MSEPYQLERCQLTGWWIRGPGISNSVSTLSQDITLALNIAYKKGVADTLAKMEAQRNKREEL